MPTQPLIRVMISSRNNSPFPAEDGTSTLSAVRRRLKQEIEDERLLDGSQLFEVWINESAPAGEGSENLWERCLREVRKADIVIVLYKGEAGWAKQEGDVGICHAELAEALSTEPAKVRIVELTPLEPLSDGAGRDRDERFRAYVGSQARFSAQAGNAAELVAACRATLREEVAEMVHLGVREARKGRFHSGQALEWSRLDFVERKNAMEATVRSALLDRNGSVENEGNVSVSIGGGAILMVCHGIPAAMTTAAAREMVGQPFLHDHRLSRLLDRSHGGPVHLVACHRNVSEAQALRQLGFPDATIVSAPFGVHVADEVQKIQMLFIGNCRDDTSTRHGVQRALDWLVESGEDRRLHERASARARIVRAIAKEAGATRPSREGRRR